jgi:hypothetical protein
MRLSRRQYERLESWSLARLSHDHAAPASNNFFMFSGIKWSCRGVNGGACASYLATLYGASFASTQLLIGAEGWTNRETEVGS